MCRFKPNERVGKRSVQAMTTVARGSLVFVMMAALLLTSTGTSLVPVTARSDSSAAAQAQSEEWYPCKGHACGCISAEVCLTNCCCRKPSGVHRGSTVYEDLAVGTVPSNGRPSFRLVIQSASCAGRDACLTLKPVVCIVEPLRVLVVSDLVVHYKPVEPSSIYISRTVSPDSPPPRLSG